MRARVRGYVGRGGRGGVSESVVVVRKKEATRVVVRGERGRRAKHLMTRLARVRRCRAREREVSTKEKENK